MAHFSGFINIIGRPNVGKSTLMNALVGERMSIITAKPQTTRHRIIGLLSGDDFQMVFSDTPGIIENPNYGMQRAMNRFVHSTFEDADLMILVIDPHETYDEEQDDLFKKLDSVQVPFFLVINKKDTLTPEQLEAEQLRWKTRFPKAHQHSISALHKDGTQQLLTALKEALPEGPAYYPKDQLSDRAERFFISEIIREKILELYHQEVPYSVEVIVNSFKEGTTQKGDPIVRIEALLFVDRKTQKPIIIGKGGSAIKKLGMESRKAIETFLEQKVFLELHVKVRENWRDDDRLLKQFGYNH
jgi:GTP-binding protein Era